MIRAFIGLKSSMIEVQNLSLKSNYFPPFEKIFEALNTASVGDMKCITREVDNLEITPNNKEPHNSIIL